MCVNQGLDGGFDVRGECRPCLHKQGQIGVFLHARRLNRRLSALGDICKFFAVLLLWILGNGGLIRWSLSTVRLVNLKFRPTDSQTIAYVLTSRLVDADNQGSRFYCVGNPWMLDEVSGNIDGASQASLQFL